MPSDWRLPDEPGLFFFFFVVCVFIGQPRLDCFFRETNRKPPPRFGLQKPRGLSAVLSQERQDLRRELERSRKREEKSAGQVRELTKRPGILESKYSKRGSCFMLVACRNSQQGGATESKYSKHGRCFMLVACRKSQGGEGFDRGLWNSWQRVKGIRWEWFVPAMEVLMIRLSGSPHSPSTTQNGAKCAHPDTRKTDM